MTLKMVKIAEYNIRNWPYSMINTNIYKSDILNFCINSHLFRDIDVSHIFNLENECRGHEVYYECQGHEVYYSQWRNWTTNIKSY